MLRNPIYAQADLELYEFFKGQGAGPYFRVPQGNQLLRHWG